MQEPEVSLWIAMKYIQEGKTSADVAVLIDGAHIKTKDVRCSLAHLASRDAFM